MTEIGTDDVDSKLENFLSFPYFKSPYFGSTSFVQTEKPTGYNNNSVSVFVIILFIGDLTGECYYDEINIYHVDKSSS